jgi:predicted nucleic acid-binding protein
VIFVDTNVVMYAVGRPHPHRDEVRARLLALPAGTLATSAEVLQELLHAYLPVGRLADLDAALRLLTDLAVVWPVTAEDVHAARLFAERHPALGARDVLHLAVCARHGATELWTYDRGLAAAFGGTSR